MRCAILDNDIVVNIVLAPDVEFAAAQGWTPSNEAQIGWLWNGTSFTAPGADLEARKTEKLDAIRSKRWEVETAGVTISGFSVRTDEVSQNKVSGAISLFDKDSTLAQIDWEAQPGVWITLDRDAMTAIGIAIGRHVQACFSNARTLMEAAQAASDIAALDAFDLNAGWPS